MLNLHISNSKTINITPLSSNITILSQVHYRLNSLYHITSKKNKQYNYTLKHILVIHILSSTVCGHWMRGRGFKGQE